MKNRFEDKIVLVTGGNSGIGLASAIGFAREGARVVITGRDEKTLARAEKEIGHGARALKADVSQLDQISSLMATLKSNYGRLDVLFANAGVSAFVPVEEVTPELWQRIVDVNLRGLFFTVQQAIPLMSQGGSIVLDSSAFHVKGRPLSSVYAATKAGVRSFARSIGNELAARGIRVNQISPGPIETPIFERTIGLPPAAAPEVKKQIAATIPMKRFGTPQEVANAVLFLASDEASYITCADLAVDGGDASV